MPKPVAVISGDIHFTPTTLELAAKVITLMQRKALELGVPIILNGDTLDSKDILRAGVVNTLIDLLQTSSVKTYVNWGNHESTNERADTHSLHFLKPYATVVDESTYFPNLESYIIPYFHDGSKLQSVLNDLPKGSRLIIHQGVQTAFMGAYSQDKSSLPKKSYADFRVIGSHYHRAQDIECGRPRRGGVGLFSYCGSPYSLSFGEANDGPKGFQVLYDTGLLELVPTNLRKHLIFQRTFAEIKRMSDGDPWLGVTPPSKNDLIWLKVTGSYQELESLNKHKLGNYLFGHSNYKLDKIYTNSVKTEGSQKQHTGAELMDKLIDNTAESADAKADLKTLWRELI